MRAMILIGAQGLSKTFSTRPLFSGLSFSIETGERVGLIGPNGAGKSTLLRILANQIDADSGEVIKKKGLKIGFLEQVPYFQPEATIESTILESAKDSHDWEELARASELTAKLDLTQ